MGLRVDWNVLLAPLIAALAEGLIKAFLKWIETWDEPGAAIAAIDKVADAVKIFRDGDTTLTAYLDLRAKLKEITLET